MPEGPEVRREADAIGAAIAGKGFVEVRFGLDRLRVHEPTLSGGSVRDVSSRGKALLVRFDQGSIIYSHNQLYGRWFITSRGQLPKTTRSLRLAIHADGRSALLYSASEIEVLREDDLRGHPYLSKLGPDILAAGVGPAAIARRLRDDRFFSRSLGALLLDQAFLAGVGNYLRSEILFEAGLHPDLRPRDLDEAERIAVGRAVRLISRRAYRQRGVTVSRSAYEGHRRLGEGRGTARFAAFAREGRECRRCGTKLEKVLKSGRRLYFCPMCQGASRRGAPAKH